MNFYHPFYKLSVWSRCPLCFFPHIFLFLLQLGMHPETSNPVIQDPWDELTSRISYLFSDEFYQKYLFSDEVGSFFIPTLMNIFCYRKQQEASTDNAYTSVYQDDFTLYS